MLEEVPHAVPEKDHASRNSKKGCEGRIQGKFGEIPGQVLARFQAGGERKVQTKLGKVLDKVAKRRTA